MGSCMDQERPWERGEREDQNAKLIKEMTRRFLSWRLPDGFNPDGGITFKLTYPVKPTGTNLLNVNQAEAMIRYITKGLL